MNKLSNSPMNGRTNFSDITKKLYSSTANLAKVPMVANIHSAVRTTQVFFENCEFAEGFEFDTSKKPGIVFKNCTYNGVKITAENAASLASGETTFFYNGTNNAIFE
ncbi:MAG: hypothetical protein IJY36_02260 [Coprobacter sp.]|nr:hypothetical protein [Coprobacter sp.]